MARHEPLSSEGRAELASNVEVKTSLRVFDVIQTVEVISLPDKKDNVTKKFPGHRRVTLHALTEDNRPVSFDIDERTFETLKPLLKIPQ